MTRLEFVTSGRSVAISDEEVGHSPAYAVLGTLMASKVSAQKQVLTHGGLRGETFIC
jgi:hypothetical protein